VIQQRTFDLIRRKQTNLVLNLDVRDPNTEERFPLPPNMEKIEFIKRIIELTSSNFAMIKLNYQFLLGFSRSTIINIVNHVKKQDCIPWVDYKLGDIGSTNEQAMHALASMKFEGITVHQVIGYKQGLENILKLAETYKFDVISLLYMSHPGAKNYFQIELSDGKKLYQKFLEDAIEWGLKGFVVGAHARFRSSKGKI